MAISDSLPDRPLTDDEFHDLQYQDGFDAVLTTEGPRCTDPDCDNHHLDPTKNDVLILHKDDTEYVLVYEEGQGWHQNTQCDRDGPCKAPTNPEEIEADD